MPHTPQARLLQAVNKTAAVLLAAEENTQGSAQLTDLLLKGMEIIGSCVGVDRIHLWKNETINGVFYYTNQIQWRSDIGKHQKPAAEKFPYSQMPEWEKTFSRNEYVNGPISTLTQPEQSNLASQGVTSVLAIPLYLHNKFWGFVSFDDCLKERTFEEDEVELLRSAVLMMISAMNRSAQEEQLRKANEYNRLMLNAMPFSVHLWDKNMKLVDCNEASNKLFKVNDKKELIERFADFSPEYQPNGQPSSNAARYVEKAFNEGTYVIEWMHRTLDGEPLPVEMALVPVKLDGDGFVACYARDLREHKQMMKEIEERDLSIRASAKKLEAVIASYSGIIWNVEPNNVIALFNGQYLGKIGLKPELFEGKTLDKALRGKRFASIREIVEKTLQEGSQDITYQLDGKTYRVRSTPIYDNYGALLSVMGAFDDISERTLLQKELEAALIDAQNANNAKTSFLASMSHEMRTPLNAIIGLSDLTLEAGGLSEEAQGNLEKINNAGITLLSTVNDILDISKIEAGRFELVPVEYDTPSIINDAVTQNIMRIDNKNVNFVLDINENIPARLYGDDLRIKQIWNNLLTNAFKYTKEGTVKFSINCKRQDDTVLLTTKVSDTGAGIRQEDIKTLFSDYAQLDTHSNRKIEGTGLGLPIAKRIAEMMGGEISVESEYGKGSVFTVTVFQQFVTDAVIGPEVLNSLKNFSYTDHRRLSNARMARISLPYVRVLVVDDVPTNLDVAKGMLKPYGMQIDCLTSGQEAIQAIREEKVRYNAIFMDHMMPEMDGIEAVRIIRNEIGSDYAKTIPIIALTANAIVGNEDMFLKSGFQAFLPKPIEIARLDGIIRKWVRDKEQEEQYFLFNPNQILELEHDFPHHLEGVDLQKAYERFRFDMEAVTNVLRSFALNTPPLLESIREVDREKLPSYAITVHGIKGACFGICAEEVGAKAAALEKAAKAEDFEFVSANNADFIKTAEKLITDLNGLLDKMAKKNLLPKKDKPDEQMLLNLLNACTLYDMDGADAAIAELESFEYKSGGELVSWLRENINLMNFQEIKERLEKETGGKQ